MTRHPNHLDPASAVLLVVDMQEAFRPAIHEFERIAKRIGIVVEGCRAIGVPIVMTEHVPHKLGKTIPELQSLLAGVPALDKNVFSACGARDFAAHLGDRSQVIVCGIEAHICVNQTCHDLLAMGRQVHVLTDAVSSRTAADREAGLAKVTRSGVFPSTTEMALFELLRDATHPAFRTVQKLIK